MIAKLKSLFDAGPSSERSISRRSLLRMICIGAGGAVTALLLPARPGDAQGGVSVCVCDINGAPSATKPAFKAQATPRTKGGVRHDGVVILHQSMPKVRPKRMRTQ